MSSVLINIPIEPLEERYSVQWDRWFMQEFAKAAVPFKTLYGDPIPSVIERGSFLDVVYTNIYKTSQLQKILFLLRDYKDDYELILFFHDVWFPGLEMIAYIREGLSLKNLKIYGCLHAGSYDEQDFLHKKGMERWAKGIEHSWFSEIVDGIFVATEFHKNLLLSTRISNEEKIHVTGFPIYHEESTLSNKKEDIVVFPHRLDSEKQPHLFDALKVRFADSGWTFVKTKECCKNKKEYFDLLSKSKIAVSFALQETWGIAMQEALFFGNIPLCPNRLSYSEMYKGVFLYDSEEDLYGKLQSLMQKSTSVDSLRNRNKEVLLQKGSAAISNMLKIML